MKGYMAVTWEFWTIKEWNFKYTHKAKNSWVENRHLACTLSRALINIRAANMHHCTRYIEKKKTFCATLTGATIIVQPTKTIVSFGRRTRRSNMIDIE